jgi:hypothetical protein
MPYPPFLATTATPRAMSAQTIAIAAAPGSVSVRGRLPVSGWSARRPKSAGRATAPLVEMAGAEVEVFTSARRHIASVAGIMGSMCLLVGLLACCATPLRTGDETHATQPEPTPNVATAATETTPPNFEDWRKAMSLVPPPKTGCYTAAYPSLNWQSVPCTSAPQHPYPLGMSESDGSAGPK